MSAANGAGFSATPAEEDLLETPVLDADRANLLQSIAEQGGYADAYSMACLHVAKLHYAAGEFSQAIRALDMGLIMGGPALRADLNLAIRKASKKASIALDSSSVQNHNIVSEEVNMAEISRILPARSLSCKLVGKRSALSLEGFIQDHYVSGTPVIIRDCLDQWPAKSKWNDLNYLRSVAGFRTVPVEIGKHYLCPEWKQELITFSEFLERIQSNDPTSTETTYLAQHPLFDQIQELRQDILIPDYCSAGGGEIKSLNAWFGPAGTVTPLHHDPHHNILAQVVGKKYIRLYPATISEELYPHSEAMLSNSSQVDLDNIEETEFEKIMEVEFEDCILEEGEMLYIPPKRWHYVRSLTTSFSIDLTTVFAIRYSALKSFTGNKEGEYLREFVASSVRGGLEATEQVAGEAAEQGTQSGRQTLWRLGI
nr:putative lysine-specific demethylase JMJD5 [Ipomoea batatas]